MGRQKNRMSIIKRQREQRKAEKKEMKRLRKERRKEEALAGPEMGEDPSVEEHAAVAGEPAEETAHTAPDRELDATP